MLILTDHPTHDGLDPSGAAQSAPALGTTLTFAGRGVGVGRIVYENGQSRPSQAQIEPHLTAMREGPKLQLDAKAGTLKIEGFFSTMQDPTIVNKAFDYFGWHKDTNVYADKFEMQVKYWPDRTNLPQLTSDVKAEG